MPASLNHRNELGEHELNHFETLRHLVAPSLVDTRERLTFRGPGILPGAVFVGVPLAALVVHVPASLPRPSMREPYRSALYPSSGSRDLLLILGVYRRATV